MKKPAERERCSFGKLRWALCWKWAVEPSRDLLAKSEHTPIISSQDYYCYYHRHHRRRRLYHHHHHHRHLPMFVIIIIIIIVQKFHHRPWGFPATGTGGGGGSISPGEPRTRRVTHTEYSVRRCECARDLSWKMEFFLSFLKPSHSCLG